MTNLDDRIDDLITSVIKRNADVQTKKKDGGFVNWTVALSLALLSLIGIGLAMWYAHRRSKELAATRTKIEQDKVLVEQKEHQAKFDTLMKNRLGAQKEADALMEKVHARKIKLVFMEKEHEQQVARIKALKGWNAITKGN